MKTIVSQSDKVQSAFNDRFGTTHSHLVEAPGRVNLIGEHTDYNEGFVFPVAIDRTVTIAARAIEGSTITVHSLDYDESDNFPIADITESEQRWSNYLRGMVQIWHQAGYPVVPFQAVISGNVPQGAGLSSSAAFEVAVATLLNDLSESNVSQKEIARLAQRAENEFIGMQCGIMDQFISALGAVDCALMIDCRDLSFRAVKLDLERADAAIVITHSGVQRGLVDSEYNKRRSECKKGCAELGKHLGREVKSLREVSTAELEKHIKELPPVIDKRCKHVVTENARVEHAVEALEKQDLERFGKLMNESHQSLKDDFEVSCPEIDILVRLTQALPGVFGARLTGGGFGGCTVAIMRKNALDNYIAQVLPEYEKLTRRKPEVYICSAVKGATCTRSST